MFFAICRSKGHRDGSDMYFALGELFAETSIGNMRPHKVKYQIEIPKRKRLCELMSVSQRKRKKKVGRVLALQGKHYFCRQVERSYAKQGKALHQRHGGRTKRGHRKEHWRQGTGGTQEAGIISSHEERRVQRGTRRRNKRLNAPHMPSLMLEASPR